MKHCAFLLTDLFQSLSGEELERMVLNEIVENSDLTDNDINLLSSQEDFDVQRFLGTFYGIYLILILVLLNQNGSSLKPQYQHACFPHRSPYVSCGTSWENLHKQQDILSLMITSFILMPCMFEEVVIL